MKIHVDREACCSQDDQLGPLDRSYELHDDCSLGDFIAAVMDSRFLQFSGTHTTMRCQMAGHDVATVFSPYLVPVRQAVLAAPTEALVRTLAGDGAVEFVFVKTVP